MRRLSYISAVRIVAAYELVIRLSPAMELVGDGSIAARPVLPRLNGTRQSILRRRIARVATARAIAAATLCGLFALELFAIHVNYGLRVTGDTPTFLALLREMALHPLQRISPFVPGAGLETSHATPYMQALAWIWRFGIASHGPRGTLVSDPVASYRLLALVGMLVTALVLHAFFLWVGQCCGRRAAWISLPILVLVFGPAHVIWAGDLSFNGFLYASFYPQTLALALLLYTLVVLGEAPTPMRVVAAILTVGATMVVHPFTGALLALLLCAEGAWRVVRSDSAWYVPGLALIAGYLLAARWPAYSLNHALAVAGPSGSALVGACALGPGLLWLVARMRPRLGGDVDGFVRRLTDLAEARLVQFAVGGLVLVVALACWEIWLLTRPFPEPLVHSNRLALYWVEDRWRWPLMFAAGASGLVGLARLGRRGIALAGLWLIGCFGIGLAGIVGLPLPVWWRFLLFCQLPLALGVADVLARSTGGVAKNLIVGTFAFAVVFKLATLVALPKQLTYFGSPLQPAYGLGRSLPGDSGLVASDPFTAYYIPGVTGHRVVSVTKAHVGSAEELAASEAGYRLLHRYYLGTDWWQAAQTMWRRGVRYVVVEKHTSLAPTTLATFSTGPTPLIRTEAERRELGTYFYRNNRVGTLIYDSPTYAVYRLDARKLFG